MAQISVRRITLLILTAVVLVGATVFAAATVARSSAVQAARQQSASGLMLTAMLNEETGARGYFQTYDPVFLAPYRAGTLTFIRALAESRGYTGGDPTLARALDNEARRSATLARGCAGPDRSVADRRPVPDRRPGPCGQGDDG